MSVLFKSPSSSGGTIGGSSKGFPPGDVSNIMYKADNQKVLIKWTDPEDTIVDEAVFVKWKGTILIRNSDHYPNSIKDGDIVIDNTIRNKYKDIFYEDIGLTNNTTYYYRFFTYSEDKVYNDSSNLVFKNKPLSFAPILKDNTWEQIASVSESGIASTLWKVGDEIDLTLSGTFNETVTLQIWDFNHFDKSDGTGKAGICFGMKNLMKDKQNISDDNKGGWNNSIMKKTTMNNVFNSMPLELRNAIKEVNTYANKGETSGGLSQGLLSKDKVFIPGLSECDNNYIEQNRTETGQTKFPIFSDDNSRKKKMSNGAGNIDWWWTRSPAYDSSWHFWFFYSEGYRGYGPYNSLGTCFCFNI